MISGTYFQIIQNTHRCIPPHTQWIHSYIDNAKIETGVASLWWVYRYWWY